MGSVTLTGVELTEFLPFTVLATFPRASILGYALRMSTTIARFKIPEFISFSIYDA
jgi:hypothetical protein